MAWVGGWVRVFAEYSVFPRKGKNVTRNWIVDWQIWATSKKTHFD